VPRPPQSVRQMTIPPTVANRVGEDRPEQLERIAGEPSFHEIFGLHADAPAVQRENEECCEHKRDAERRGAPEHISEEARDALPVARNEQDHAYREQEPGEEGHPVHRGRQRVATRRAVCAPEGPAAGQERKHAGRDEERAVGALRETHQTVLGTRKKRCVGRGREVDQRRERDDRRDHEHRVADHVEADEPRHRARLEVVEKGCAVGPDPERRSNQVRIGEPAVAGALRSRLMETGEIRVGRAAELQARQREEPRYRCGLQRPRIRHAVPPTTLGGAETRWI